MKIKDVSEGIDYDYIIKCENCDKDVLKFGYESCCGSHEVLDKHAAVYCWLCKPRTGMPPWYKLKEEKLCD